VKLRTVGVVLVAAGLVTGCGTTASGAPTTVLQATPALPPGPAAAPTLEPDSGLPAGVLVVPASSHVTGLPYPAHCTSVAGGQLPDPVCTPGSIRDDINPNDLERNVCKKGWSGTVRPPKAETDKLKTQAMRAYGVPAVERSHTELDHRVPESLGGASDVTNLWPQVSDLHGAGYHNSKDGVEDDIHAWVCSGHQDRWQQAIVVFTKDWRTAKKELGVP
jgi:hypothetical protein